jgi:hypothetical protein
MAGNMTVSSVLHGAVNQSGKTEAVATTRNSNYTPGIGPDGFVRSSMLANTSALPTFPTHQIHGPTERGHPPSNRSNGYTHTAACDTTWYYRAYGGYQDNGKGGSYPNDGTDYSWDSTLKTYAINPTLGLTVLSGETSSTVTVNGTPNPGTNESTVTVYIQYKQTGNPTWTQWGPSVFSGTGYTAQAITETTITGLDAETSYDFRLYMNRGTTTNPTVNYWGSTTTTSTIADVPTVTTDPASSVGITTATLNATVDHNTKDGDLSWRYLLTSAYSAPPDDIQGFELAYSGNPITGDSSVGELAWAPAGGAGELTANSAYTFWAIYEYDGETIFGDADTFSTQVDPGQQAADGEMLQVQKFDRKWGVATTVFFVVPQNAGSSSDLFYDAAAVWGAGETKVTGIVYDDDSTPTITAEADTASNPARVASTNLYRLDLSATEMQHDELYITLTNAGTSVRDVMLHVRTHQMMSTIDLDASNKGTNTTALTVTGKGTGDGASFVAGATGHDIRGVLGQMVLRHNACTAGGGSTVDLDASASGTADFFNGCMIMMITGTSIGQSRIITDYDTSQQCTVDTAWSTNPVSGDEFIILGGSRPWDLAATGELSSVPTETSSYGKKVDFLFQRFAFKITQTATIQSWKKSDSSTELGSRAVDDDGTTQSINKLA